MVGMVLQDDPELEVRTVKMAPMVLMDSMDDLVRMDAPVLTEQMVAMGYQDATV